MRVKKIGITGASGHIGNLLCEMLLEQGHEIGALVYRKAVDIEGVKSYKASIRNPEEVDAFVKEHEYIIHLAAEITIGGHSKTMWPTNVEGTKNILRACQKHQIKRLVHFSSIAAIEQFPLNEAIDETRALVTEQSKTSRYGLSKAAAEREVLQAAAKGLDVVIIVPTSVMGPPDKRPSVLGKTLMDLYHNNLPALIDGGQDWVDVRDICQGTIAALEKGRSGEKYILGSEFKKLKDVSSIIAETFNRKTPKNVLPFWLAQLGIPFEAIKSKITGNQNAFTREALNTVRYGNQRVLHDKATKDLGYQPRSVEESIKDSIQWFLEEETKT